ncbi:hypothetical protein J7I91_24930 [Pseudomonas sp. ISL-84]|nr:hypothetical protein [Pseudomonas sp. ISL-84]
MALPFINWFVSKGIGVFGCTGVVVFRPIRALFAVAGGSVDPVVILITGLNVFVLTGLLFIVQQQGLD